MLDDRAWPLSGKFRFSPLREGDNIIAGGLRTGLLCGLRFSPLREGDNIIAGTCFPPSNSRVSFSPLREGDNIIAEYLLQLLAEVRQFQSPSRRGQHHCSTTPGRLLLDWYSFSPLREGDNIIASSGEYLERGNHRFSPLREGDNIIAYTHHQIPSYIIPFQSPSRRGQHHCEAKDYVMKESYVVSVPFAKGTTSLHPCQIVRASP